MVETSWELRRKGALDAAHIERMVACRGEAVDSEARCGSVPKECDPAGKEKDKAGENARTKPDNHRW